MCGICGTVGRADEPLLTAMTESLRHRGPDGAGVRCFADANGFPPAGLGHRRLAIIDPTPRGAQPMSYAGGRYWITYNGELYNFRQLRSGLERDGFAFHSDCDTEVLLAMYARDGHGMFDSLNGIYAFAIWDSECHELLLARDRLGVKPLYYAQHDGVLYFASEVKALLQALPKPDIRPEAVADYLTFLWVPEPDTIFSGIYKVPAGHYAVFRDGRLDLHEHWDMTFDVERRSERDWAELLRAEVDAAVRRQMVSDVPLGSFLSGGLDSSAIVASMAAQPSERVTTYSIGYSPEDLAYEIVPDDLRYARAVGRELGVDHHEQILRPDIVNLLPQLVWHMDEPVADPAAISTYLICAAAREKLTVILSGMGGDEIFAGYPRHLAAWMTRAGDAVPRAARAALRRTVEGRMKLGAPGRLRTSRRNLIKLMRGVDADPVDRYLVYCSYYRGEELERVLSADLRAELADHDPMRRHRAHFERVRGEHWLNRLLYVDVKTFLPCLNLTYTDKMSMAASTEVRVPLLDDELVELSGRIPPGLKLRRAKRKYILKRSMERVLPREVVWRRKAGFGAPVRSWVLRDLKPMIGELLSPECVASRGLLDPAGVQDVIRASDAGAEDNALRIWAMLTLEVWQREFMDAVPSARHRALPPVVHS
jgi:asparagine synthase (glutamine-hydrolysing)